MALRPLFSALDSKKITSEFLVSNRYWIDALHCCIEERTEEKQFPA
jgi:dTDP-4-dehydrorhamnose reductase